jgi:glycosyltransferase involved in cell wall biosynthesis
VRVVASGKDMVRAQELFKKHGVIKDFPYASVRSLIVYIFKNLSSFDVLYFRDPKLFYLAFIIRFVFLKKVIFEAHGSHEWRWMKPIWLTSFYVSNGAVFITKKLQEWYDPREKKPAVVVHVNAPDFNLFSDGGSARASVRQELNISHNTPLLVYAGNTMWYDIVFLLHLLSMLPAEYTLLIVGLKDDEKEELTAKAIELGVDGRARFVGRVVNTMFVKYLLAADVLLIPPTLTYPGSICSKLYEYLAAGVPIVAHPAGANDEVLDDGKNALLVNSSTPRAFADAIVRLQHNETLNKSLSNQALEDAKKYTWNQRANAISSLLYRMVSVKN